VRTLPVLLIVTFRPEFQPAWTGQPQVTMLALNRLDRRDRTALIEQIAVGAALADKVIDQIADRTDGVTGRGADLILIDDPLKPDEALSDAQRKAANDWFSHTLYSRLNDKRSGAIVIIMQRLHEDDLVGHVLAQEPWEVVCFPAIAEVDEEHEIETIWGPRCFRRRQGEALHPAREPLDILDRIRWSVGEYNFAGQYQQSPAPLGGGLVKAEWFKRYRENERPERFDRIVQSWDTANKATELSDFSVCTT
jgi:hypothetical protein